VFQDQGQKGWGKYEPALDPSKLLGMEVSWGLNTSIDIWIDEHSYLPVHYKVTKASGFYAKDPGAELAVLRRRRIGFLHQLFNLLPDLTAGENVALPLLLDGLPEAEVQARVRSALAQLGIQPLHSRRPDELSGGEMQRVALARALVIRPLLVLADEPTGSLDRENGQRVLELFREIHRRGDTTLVLVTHDAEVAAAARRRIRIVDGSIAG
jgi:putative ABC transport system ATP-binding protein